MTHPSEITKHTNRLIVFRACKQFMDSHQRQPAIIEIEELVGPKLERAAIKRHMQALNGADGLDFPTWPPLSSDRADRGFRNVHGGVERMPVDVLMTNARAAANGVDLLQTTEA